MRWMLVFVLLISISTVSAIGDGSCESWGFDEDYCCYDWYGGSYEECFGCLDDDCSPKNITKETVEATNCNLLRSKIKAPGEIYDTNNLVFYKPHYTLEDSESSFKTAEGLKSFSVKGSGWQIEKNNSFFYLEYVLRDFTDSNFSAADFLIQISSNKLCSLREINFKRISPNHWDSKYVAICPYLSGESSLGNSPSFDQVLFWSNEGLLVSVSVHNSSIEKEKDSLEKIQVEFLDLLFDSQELTLDEDLQEMELSFPIQYLFETELSSCDSDLDYNFYWGCDIDPLFCPSSGKQIESCVDYTSGNKIEREVSCSADTCSGCSAEDYLEGEGEKVCIGKGEKFVGDSDEIYYCDISGEIFPQKDVSTEGKKTLCNSDFECETNVCSLGNCVDMDSFEKEIGGFSRFFNKVGCRFSVFFEKSSSRERCLYDKFR